MASNLCRTVTLPTSPSPHLRRLSHLCNNFWKYRDKLRHDDQKKQNNTKIAVEDFVPSWASWVSHFKVAPGLLGLLLHLYSTYTLWLVECDKNCKQVQNKKAPPPALLDSSQVHWESLSQVHLRRKEPILINQRSILSTVQWKRSTTTLIPKAHDVTRNP